MPLTQPDWFSDLEAWWTPAVGEEVARHVEPVGIDDSSRLHVRCSRPAWHTQTRLMGAALTERVNEVLAPRTEIADIVVQAASGAVPRIVQDRWPDIVGEDLAGQVEPVMLALQGQELCTVAVSVAARDEAARRAPEILARIRALIGEQCAITRWSPSSLMPVVVLVTGSASVTQRQTVEDVLLQTWHDAIEAFDTEHTLILEHGCETPTDRFVSEWVARLQLPDDAHLMSAPMAADAARHYDRAVFVRDQQMVARRPDLCRAFVRDTGEVLPLEQKASTASIPVQRVLLP
ncbi:DciA family protein [Streptomyces sp. NPDC018955]|uniref:DciA family protein n=1 Tax=Streptomyces sp. NPDC018955 TaxID=3365055 RepID=UPI0037AA96EB